ncbi:MAG: glycosyltransferase family 39 protein [Solirubrobacterales bacterium]|nr:glycosyltransferase family 39 protein [Solirubrobacterales bacterium]
MRLTVLMLIVLSGLFLRLDQAWQGAEHNLPDSAAYERIARGVSRDGVFEQRGPGTPLHPQPASNYTPGLPLLTAGIFELTGGDSVRVARLVLALIATVAIPISWRIGSRLGGDVAAIAAAAITAFYPTSIADSGMLLTEPLTGTLIAGAVLAVLWAREQSGLHAWALPGLLLGLTSLVRPEALLVSGLLAMVLFALQLRAGLRAALLPVAVMSVATAVVVAPLIARDLSGSGRLVPLSTGGGQTLFTGSYAASGGDPTDVMPRVLRSNPDIRRQIMRQNRRSGEGPASITPERVLALLAERRHPGTPADAALSKMGRDSYISQFESDPTALSRYLLGKAGRIWWRGRWELIDSLPGRIVHRGLIFACLTGMLALAVRRRPEFWIVGTPLLSATVIGAVLVASPRRVLALWPLVGAVAGVGLAGLVRLAFGARIRRRWGRSHSLTAPDALSPQPDTIAVRR